MAEAPAGSSAAASGAQSEAAGQQEHHKAPAADAAGPSWAAWRADQSGEVRRSAHACCGKPSSAGSMLMCAAIITPSNGTADLMQL